MANMQTKKKEKTKIFLSHAVEDARCRRNVQATAARPPPAHRERNPPRDGPNSPRWRCGQARRPSPLAWTGHGLVARQATMPDTGIHTTGDDAYSHYANMQVTQEVTSARGQTGASRALAQATTHAGARRQLATLTSRTYSTAHTAILF